jgi:hypothetical protein
VPPLAIARLSDHVRLLFSGATIWGEGETLARLTKGTCRKLCQQLGSIPSGVRPT